MSKEQTELQKTLKAYLEKNPGGEHRLASELGFMTGSIKRWMSGVSTPHPLVAQAVINYLKRREEKK